MAAALKAGTMKNVDVKVEGNTLILKIDLTKIQGPSASGKTTIIGTTGGNQVVAEIDGKPVTLGLNCYTK
jgi:hypothetical protein